jgi:formamidopyrimidine-DNA glycosylase
MLTIQGWFYIKGEQTFYYKRSEPPPETGEWPPRFWKFTLETEATADAPKVEAAFADSRRFGRIRLLHCDGEKIRQTTPLKENGPDPVVDQDVLTLEWLTKLMHRKHVPVKALLLDQANISGIGNWVG